MEAGNGFIRAPVFLVAGCGFEQELRAAVTGDQHRGDAILLHCKIN
jgi:hypothetical protein